jgi:hypothetical protein
LRLQAECFRVRRRISKHLLNGRKTNLVCGCLIVAMSARIRADIRARAWARDWAGGDAAKVELPGLFVQPVGTDERGGGLRCRRVRQVTEQGR